MKLKLKLELNMRRQRKMLTEQRSLWTRHGRSMQMWATLGELCHNASHHGCPLELVVH